MKISGRLHDISNRFRQGQLIFFDFNFKSIENTPLLFMNNPTIALNFVVIHKFLCRFTFRRNNFYTDMDRICAEYALRTQVNNAWVMKVSQFLGNCVVFCYRFLHLILDLEKPGAHGR